MKKVLCIGSHTDDVELGMGATVNKLVQQGCDVTIAIMSSCGLPALKGESANSADVLFVDSYIAKREFPVRMFEDHRQEVLDVLRGWADQGFDTVFTHASTDCHQDHQVVYNETIRAFKRCTILGYELPWNSVKPFDARFFSVVGEPDYIAKMRALSCYESQQHRDYFDESYQLENLAFRGNQCGAGTGMAEAFEVIRWVS